MTPCSSFDDKTDIDGNLFGSATDQEAYESFVANQEPVESFTLDAPALVCRWRMSHKRVPMLNRHIRALSQRLILGEPLSHNMLSWAKQHVEWSLTEGAYTQVNGVLMLVIDVNGNAAMTVGDYVPLEDATLEALQARAATAQAEAKETRVAPELLAAVESDVLTLAAPEADYLCGTATLVEQLATTRGLTVKRQENAADLQGAHFLISDEHGIVQASNEPKNETATFLAASYETLRSRTK